jgi:hypothetical protein
MQEPGFEDVLAAAEAAHNTLAPAVDHDWTVPSGDVEWDCRYTLDHISNALIFYAGSLATNATERIRNVRNPGDGLLIGDLLESLKISAAILARVIEAQPSSARGFHPAGMADPSGFAGMACDEILVHTSDIAAGLGVVFQPTADLSAKVVGRLFPWAPTDIDQWQTLLWANGRTWLPYLGHQESNWQWHCKPLSEWDGTITKR